MTPTITIDLETRSYADLPKVGAWSYSEDETTDVICAAWGIGDAEIQTWWPGKDMKYVPCYPDFPGPPGRTGGTPYDLYMALMAGANVEAHNLAFEWGIWENILTPRYGWILPDFHNKGRDTMAVACYYGMPAALDKLARALNYEAKDPAGTRLISKYSKLFLKTAKEEIPPKDLEKFVEYCVKDVQIEQSVSDDLGELPERELPIFQLDLKKMRRGLFLDEEGIATATAIVEERDAELTTEFKRLTGLGPAQHAKVKEWFAINGLELENMQKQTLEDLLKELPSGIVRRAIELRLSVNKASTKKLAAMARAAGRDGRAKFQTRYHGAFTGRTTGTGFQPLNLTRGFDDVDPETFPAQLVRDISYGSPKWLDCLYGDAMVAVSNASRYWIRAEEGNRIMSADFASIEAIVLACLAGEQWKIDAFTAGDPIYELMGCKIHNLPQVAVDLARSDKKEFKKKFPAERQDGKTGELAFGFRGALGAWLKFDNSGRHSDARIIEICQAWRAEHPETISYWDELEEAAIEAVMYPGRATAVRDGGGFEIVDEWLSQELVNGKRIWYRDPEIRSWMPNWHKPKQITIKDEEGEEIPNPCYTGDCNCKPVPTLTYMSQKLGSWRRVSTYSGKLAENRVQATSREILKCAELAVDAAGYDLILDVYDELVAEVPKGFGSAEDFLKIIEVRPDFAKSWPISADVWTGERYRK